MTSDAAVTPMLAPDPGVALEDVVILDAMAGVDQWNEARVALLTADVVGFDTESRPTFRKGEASTGPHLVQLAAARRVYLFPLRPGSETVLLRSVLEAPGIVKAGFGLDNDRHALHARWNIDLHSVLDLGEVLRGAWHRGTVGAKTAVAWYFGQRMSKSKKIGTSNWASSRLSEAQIRYAANDARVALAVYRAWCEAGRRPPPQVEALVALAHSTGSMAAPSMPGEGIHGQS
ncbi:MAG: 3'-5' exonuclease domain-containing protein 2 [Proteobacteria bacterium]|nr:3'-5' exonuclease domain-containing protein 2 [Pseudomonadota bacterium]HQR04128.1 3'-5' exonuclease [Rhodocyclaceae bacterium]